MNEKITLIVATRERSLNVVRFWQSFKNTVTTDDVDILFLIDADDVVTQQTIQGLGATEVKALVGKRENVPIRINEAWSSVTSDIVGLFGDDIVFQTKSWDRKVVEAFKTWPDEIGVVYGSDGFQNEKLCTHPFLSRKWIETLGYAAHDGFFHYCVDTWLHDVARRVNRLLYLPDVLFEHLHPDAHKAKPDLLRRCKVKYFQHDVDILESTVKQRQEDAEKLLKVMQ